ncbi:hypothetical protein BH11PAT1_BH11PAT1_4440 [soil metagenome]
MPLRRPIHEQNETTTRPVYTIPLPSRSTTTPLLVVGLIIASFLLGMLTTKVQYLEKNGTKTPSALTAGTNTTPAPAAAAAPGEDKTPKKVSIDNDPVLGNKDAKVTIIEFSDYECPFCKRHFEQTYPQLKKEYIDTGKAKLVFRDMPLSFHQNAHKEAEAAECVREQGGDELYFKFHDAMFTKTTSNGTGLTLTDLPGIADIVGANGQTMQSCLDAGKYTTEVDKDMADAAAVGANATPSFFIGRSDPSGTITGTPIIGAYPIENFKTLIEAAI